MGPPAGKPISRRSGPRSTRSAPWRSTAG
jgi:hypothetical protein